MQKRVSGSARLAPELRIRPTGNVGNQMLQLMVVSDVQRRVPSVELCGHHLPMWGIAAPCGTPSADDDIVLGGGYIPVRQIAGYFRRGVVDRLTIAALSFHVGKFGRPQDHSHRFVAPLDLEVEVFGAESIVVSVRAAEILTDDHPDYGPIPLSFIEQAVTASGKHPVFVGQLGDDVYSQALRQRFPDATFCPSRGELVDFETLRRASEIVVSVSTFAWVAAWLSDAKRIHLPVKGLYHPGQRPDLDLLPADDPRYVFYECEVRRWHATPDDFEYLWAPRHHRVLQRHHLRLMKANALRRVLWSRFVLCAGFARRCRLARWRSHRAE